MTTYEMKQGSYQMNTGRFIAGILLGGLAGAVTLLLVAPKSGKETRQIISAKAIELRDRTADTVEKVSGQVGSKATEIRAGVVNKAVEMTHQGREMLAMQLDRLSVAAQNGRRALQAQGNHKNAN